MTGFLPRIKEKFQGEVSIDNGTLIPPIKRIPMNNPILRPEQIEALDAIFRFQRGVVHLPTGTGKTMIFLNVIQEVSKDLDVLILLHTQDLLIQTLRRAEQIFPGQVGVIGAGQCTINRINIAMVQTLYKLNIRDAFENLGIVIVDETHHLSKMMGTYTEVLKQLPNTPMRLGFTGTLPYTSEGKMVLEGYIGPVIYAKATQEVKSLAKPKIILRKIPETPTVRELKKFQDVYELGVVFNRRRNRMVLDEAKKLLDQGKSVLILVTRKQHGFNLLKMAAELYHIETDFVYGNTSKEIRERIKSDLENLRLKMVIADAVWREGIDIPSLGAVINAAGGKSEIMTIQAIGRGLRKVPGKDEVIIVDFFDDSHRYLVSHFGQRVTLYFDEGWL